MPSASSLHRFVLPLICVAWFALWAVAVCPLMDEFSPHETGAVLVYASFGMLGAGAILLAIWTAMSPHAVWVRLAASAAAALVWYASWFLGLVIAMRERGSVSASEQRMALVSLLCLPLVALAMQSPLWLARFVWHWRVDRDPTASQRVSRRPISIRDLLLVTGLVSGSLAGTRAAFAVAEVQDSSSAMQFWLGVAGTIAICGGISLAVSIPMLLATLWARSLALGLLAIAIYAGTLFAVTMTAIAAFIPGALTEWNCFGFGVLAGSFVAGMAAPLLLTRLGGYRMLIGRMIRPIDGDQHTSLS